MNTGTRIKSFTHPVARIFNWVAYAALFLLPAFLDSDYNFAKSKLPEFTHGTIEWFSAWSFFVLLPTGLVAFTTDRYLRGSLPKNVDRAVKSLLDGFHSAAFPTDDSNIDHRVTIFRYKSIPLSNIWYGKKPWGGWLIPYERSGQFSRKSRARFYAPKDRPNRAEGFASKVFTSGNCEYLPNLVNPATSPKNAAHYARQTGVPLVWVNSRVKKGDPMPRCLWGTPIEVNGQTWGVIIVDSVKTSLSGSDELKKSFGNTGICLSHLLNKEQE